MSEIKKYAVSTTVDLSKVTGGYGSIRDPFSCPKCGGNMIAESLGMKCLNCRGILTAKGEFHEYVERPFMPPKTNLDNMQSMSAEDFERVCGHQSLCSYIQEWDKEHCESQDECNGCIKAWLEKEVKNERT